MAREQFVGCDLVGCGVIGLGEDLAEDQMWRIKAVQMIDPRQQVGRHALHQPDGLAVNIAMQAAEIGDAGCCPHAAEKAVALDQQRAAAGARGSHGRGDARGSATENGDFIFAVKRNLARGFFNGFGRHGSGPIPDDFCFVAL